MADPLLCSNSHLMKCKKDECTKKLAHYSQIQFQQSYKNDYTCNFCREHTVQDKASDIGSKFPG